MDIIDCIGNTPLVKISDRIYAKLETYNPSGSVKDRMASYILLQAEKNNDIKKGGTIIEASSGNTGVSFSMLAAARGYKSIVIMPYNMSEERKRMMRLYGAEIIEVEHNAFREAIQLRDQKLAENPEFWSPKQFSNILNIECHEDRMGQEIINQLKDMKLKASAFVTGGGTGGTFMGVRAALKNEDDGIKAVFVMPAEDAASHGIQGINDGEDFLIDKNLIDETIKIPTEDAKERTKRLIKENGLLVGISSGANVLAAERWTAENSSNGVVVTFLCDRGERYLSCL